MNLMQHESFRRDVARAVAGHDFDLTGDGRIYLPAAKAYLGGVFTTAVNGADVQVDPNLLPDAALIDVLSVYFKGGTQRTGFYLAPFAGNVDPQASLTAAAFAATMTEFTAYNETARQAWTPRSGALASPAIDNSAAPATLTVNADRKTVWGFGLLTTPGKGDGSGLLVACSKFASARAGLMAGDKLNAQYSFTATDAGGA